MNARGSSANSSARFRARAGFTLIELMLVMGLLALMLGVGIGMFSRIDLGDRVALAQVQNVIRSAHNWAVARQAPARVILDTKTGKLSAEGLQVIGTWHFEAHPILGAFGVTGSDTGGKIVDNGFQGMCLSFVGEPARSKVEMPVHVDTAYDLRRGFSVSIALELDGLNGGAVLDLGGSLGLEVLDDGALRGWITGETLDEQGQPQRGKRIPITTQPGVLVPKRWSVVRFEYDRRRLAILVDGGPAAEVAETVDVSRPDHALVLSPGNQAFPGALDSLVVSAVVASETSELPRTVAFGKGTPPEILFQAGGALLREKHQQPIRFALEFDSGRTEQVAVNLYGTVE